MNNSTVQLSTLSAKKPQQTTTAIRNNKRTIATNKPHIGKNNSGSASTINVISGDHLQQQQQSRNQKSHTGEVKKKTLDSTTTTTVANPAMATTIPMNSKTQQNQSGNSSHTRRTELSFCDVLTREKGQQQQKRQQPDSPVTELTTAISATTGQAKTITYTMANAQTTTSKSYAESSLNSQQSWSIGSSETATTAKATSTTVQIPSPTQQSDTATIKCNLNGNSNSKKQQQQQQGDQTVESSSVRDQGLNIEQRHRKQQDSTTGTSTETISNANTNTTTALADYIIATATQEAVVVTALEIENKKDVVKNKTVDCAKVVAHHSSSATAAAAEAVATKVKAKAAVAASDTHSLLPDDIRNLQFKSVQVEPQTQTKSTTFTTNATANVADTLTTSTASSNAVLNSASINSTICTNSSLVTSTSLATNRNSSNTTTDSTTATTNTTTNTITTNTMSTATGNGNTSAIETTSTTDSGNNIDNNDDNNHTTKGNTSKIINNNTNNNSCSSKNKQYYASNGPPSEFSQESGQQHKIEPKLKDSKNIIESNPINMSGNTNQESGRQDNKESTSQNSTDDSTQQTEVRPASQNLNTRCVILLREIEATTSEEEVKGIFNHERCPSVPIQCDYAHNYSWYVTFKTDVDAQLALCFIREHVPSFKDKAISARIKTRTSNNTTTATVPIVSAPNQSSANVVLTNIVPSPIAHTSTTSALYTPPENIKNLNGVLTNSYVQTSREHLQVMSTISTSDQAFLSKQHQDPSMTLNGPNFISPTHHPSHYGHSHATYYGPGPMLAPWTPQPSAPFYDLSDVFIYNGLAPHPSSIKSLNGGQTGNSLATSNQAQRSYNHEHNGHVQQQQVNSSTVNGPINTRNASSNNCNPNQRHPSNRHQPGRHHTPTVNNLQPLSTSASATEQRLSTVMITGPKIVRASVGPHHATSSVASNSTMPNQDNQSTKTTHNQHPMSRMVSDNSCPGDSHTSDSIQDTSMRVYNSSGRRSDFTVTGRNNIRSHNRSQPKESNSNSIDKPNDNKQNIMSPTMRSGSNEPDGGESFLNCNLSKASSSTTNPNIDMKDKNNNSRKQANSQVIPNQQQDNHLPFRAKSSGGDHQASRTVNINQYHPSSSTIINNATMAPSYTNHGSMIQGGNYGPHSSFHHNSNTRGKDRQPHRQHHTQNQHSSTHHQQLKKTAPFDLESSAFPPLPLVQDLVSTKVGEPSPTNPLVTTASIVRSSHTSDTESLVK